MMLCPAQTRVDIRWKVDGARDARRFITTPVGCEMTNYQAILAEVRGLADDKKLGVGERIELLTNLIDDLRNWIDELRNEQEQDGVQ